MCKKASIIIIKAVADNGKTDNEALYDALVYAEKNGATVINASIGGFQISDKVISQIKKLNKKNITVVAAAGDYANKDLLFPASAPTVISVEARDNKNSL